MNFFAVLLVWVHVLSSFRNTHKNGIMLHKPHSAEAFREILVCFHSHVVLFGCSYREL